MSRREEFLSSGAEGELPEGDLLLEQSAIPNPGVPFLPSEYVFSVHSPPREVALLEEEVIFFSLILICNLIQLEEQSRKRCYLGLDVSSCPKNISQREYEVQVLEHEDGVKKI